MALQSRMHLARPRGVRPGCRVCPMGAPRTPAPARAKQQAPGGVPGTWNRPPDRGYFAGPWFDFREPRRCGGFSPANTRGNLPQNISKSRRGLVGTLCRACVPCICVFEAGRQQDVKSRLFGGLRGRKGRETSGSDMFRRNKTTTGGRGVRIRV